MYLQESNTNCDWREIGANNSCTPMRDGVKGGRGGGGRRARPKFRECDRGLNISPCLVVGGVDLPVFLFYFHNLAGSGVPAGDVSSCI